VGVWADEVTLDQSSSGVVIAPGGAPHVEQSVLGALVTGKAQVHNSAIGFVVAGKVEGDFWVLFGPQSALAFGAAAGAVLALVLRLTRRK